MRVLVTGASGALGRDVVPVLRGAGHEVRALSRVSRPGQDGVSWVRGDLATGEGLAPALRDVETVVHLASAPYRRGYTREVDVEGTRRLTAAARSAGVRHLLYVSIVGADRVPWGYFRIKVEAEQIVRSSGPAWTVLRATQFYSLLDKALRAAAHLPVVPYDRGIVAQAVDTGDVARRLAELLTAGPREDVVEVGGPQVLGLREAAEQWLAATGRRRVLVPVRVPGRLGAAFRARPFVTSAEPTGTTTWNDYLASRGAASAVA